MEQGRSLFICPSLYKRFTVPSRVTYWCNLCHQCSANIIYIKRGTLNSICEFCYNKVAEYIPL